jgi:hypothetical protein
MPPIHNFPICPAYAMFHVYAARVLFATAITYASIVHFLVRSSPLPRTHMTNKKMYYNSLLQSLTITVLNAKATLEGCNA